MTTKEEAKENLKKSIDSLNIHQSNITDIELEKEVIYWCCYEIIKKRKKKTSGLTDDLQIFNSFRDSILDIAPISKVYTEAAMELFPNNYDIASAIIATEAVKNNIFEDNMWDILKDYFLKNHGFDIDYSLFEEGGVRKFNMKSLRQIENTNRTINNIIDITICFIDDERIFITVGEEIKEMAVLIKNEEDWYNLTYKHESEVYKFIIRYNESFNPSSFVVINQKNNRMVEYFEK